MFDKVLLVAPPSSSYMGAARPPTGLGYLAESLLRAGIEYQVEDMRVKGRFSALERRVRAFQPDLIGVSMVSFEYQRTYELVRQIRQLAPETTIVAGGPHLSVMREAVLEECAALDYGVMGEGERTLVSLCRGTAPLDKTPGLLYRRNGQALSGGEPRLIADLDNIPFPRYVGFDLRRYVREIPLITSRGCPYRCIFCPNSLIKNQFMARSAASVADEIEYWYERGVRQFNVDDDNFTLLKERVHALCDEIERRRLTGLFMRCANGIRADRVDRPLLARMVEAGFREVGIGADGGNNHVLLDIIHKNETIETIEQAIRDALDVGMKVKLFAILGHPGETLSDIEDTLALAQRYPFLRVQLYNPIPYPGTELYEIVRSKGYLLMPPEEYLNNIQDNDGTTPIYETPELPASVRHEVLVRARKIEKLVTRRAVERMFQNLPVIRTVAGALFATSVGRWLFFNNRLVRTVVDKSWYHKVVRAEKPRPSS